MTAKQRFVLGLIPPGGYVSSWELARRVAENGRSARTLSVTMRALVEAGEVETYATGYKRPRAG